jgi:hypothetical protein
MKITLALLLAMTVTASAEDWSVGTTVYKDVKIINHDAAYVTILDSDGGATIELSNLPPALQKRFGYDPTKAAALIAANAANDQKDQLAPTPEKKEPVAQPIPIAQDSTGVDAKDPPSVELPILSPFNSLRWDDGMVDVISKLNQLSGLRSLVWHVHDALDADHPSVLHLTTVAELENLSPPRYSFDDPNPVQFINHQNVQVNAASDIPTTIEASPITIAGIRFSLTAVMHQAFGFAIAYPKKVLTLRSKNVSLELPLVLSGVVLQSESPSIPDHLDELLAALKSKYPKGVVVDNKGEGVRTGQFLFKEDDGSGILMEFVINSDVHQVEIDYSPGDQLPGWAEIYRRHLSSLQPSAGTDMKSGL